MKTIPDHPKYQVSEDGYVYNTVTNRRLRLEETNRGYFRVTLSTNGKTQRISIHRLVATIYLPNPENKDFVNHKDGNKSNNSVSNLEWATQSENQKHAYVAGLQKRTPGWESPLADLTREQVEDIRKCYVPRKITQQQLADKHGVSRETVKDALRGKTYKNDL